MKQIKLTRNKYALIDDDDFEMVSEHSWSCTNHGYAESRINKKLIRLHRFIMNPTEDMFVDHINMDKLDNRKSNLRICTKSENMRNRGKTIVNISGYKGVTWDTVNKKWRSQIKIGKINRNLGRYLVKEDAARAYNKAATENHGSFARLNIITL